MTDRPLADTGALIISPDDVIGRVVACTGVTIIAENSRGETFSTLVSEAVLVRPAPGTLGTEIPVRTLWCWDNGWNRMVPVEEAYDERDHKGKFTDHGRKTAHERGCEPEEYEIEDDEHVGDVAKATGRNVAEAATHPPPYEWRHGWIPLNPHTAKKWRKKWPPAGGIPKGGSKGAPGAAKPGKGKGPAPHVKTATMPGVKDPKYTKPRNVARALKAPKKVETKDAAGKPVVQGDPVLYKNAVGGFSTGTYEGNDEAGLPKIKTASGHTTTVSHGSFNLDEISKQQSAPIVLSDRELDVEANKLLDNIFGKNKPEPTVPVKPKVKKASAAKKTGNAPMAQWEKDLLDINDDDIVEPSLHSDDDSQLGISWDTPAPTADDIKKSVEQPSAPSNLNAPSPTATNNQIAIDNLKKINADLQKEIDHPNTGPGMKKMYQGEIDKNNKSIDVLSGAKPSSKDKNGVELAENDTVLIDKKAYNVSVINPDGSIEVEDFNSEFDEVTGKFKGFKVKQGYAEKLEDDGEMLTGPDDKVVQKGDWVTFTDSTGKLTYGKYEGLDPVSSGALISVNGKDQAVPFDDKFDVTYSPDPPPSGVSNANTGPTVAATPTKMYDTDGSNLVPGDTVSYIGEKATVIGPDSADPDKIIVDYANGGGQASVHASFVQKTDAADVASPVAPKSPAKTIDPWYISAYDGIEGKTKDGLFVSGIVKSNDGKYLYVEDTDTGDVVKVPLSEVTELNGSPVKVDTPKPSASAPTTPSSPVLKDANGFNVTVGDKVNVGNHSVAGGKGPAEVLWTDTDGSVKVKFADGDTLYTSSSQLASTLPIPSKPASSPVGAPVPKGKKGQGVTWQDKNGNSVTGVIKTAHKDGTYSVTPELAAPNVTIKIDHKNVIAVDKPLTKAPSSYVPKPFEPTKVEIPKVDAPAYDKTGIAILPGARVYHPDHGLLEVKSIDPDGTVHTSGSKTFNPKDLSMNSYGIGNPNPYVEQLKKMPDPKMIKGHELSGQATYYAAPNASNLPYTNAERSAMKYYTGSGYGSMNSFLRFGKSSVYDDDTVKKHIKHLDSLFDKAPPLEQDVLVTRGVSNAEKMFGPVGSKVGKTFHDKAYMSTTSKVAGAGFGGTKIRIKVPAGLKVLRPNGIGSYGDSEGEVLLPRGMKFIIVSDKMVDGSRRMEMELVPE